MPRRENGEFEVLLGNKQLLSVFFIVVILLGVFFTMGYILGRNSKPAETTPIAQAANPARQPAQPQEGTESAFGGSNSFEPAPAQAPPASPVPVEQPKPAVPAPPPAAPPAAAEPAPGQTFLQVAAVGRPEAEVVADVLKKKGFPSVLAAHPTEPVFRVLVGPLADVDAISKTRSALQDAGFKPILRKY